ncbi:hypothetical protein BJX63DRAFT_435522 [Aspergillus granulosus]|uniref:Uncharacterized protein n=1 Tax=Aspergillus granulosus TaxID=176169 RepID=A0ABR4H1C8_9EURO
MEPVRGYQLPSGTAQCSQHHSKNNVHHPASPTSSIPHPDLIHAVPINNYSPIAVPSFSLLNSSVSSFHDASGSHNISDGYFPTKASSWDGSMAPMSPFSQGVTDCTFPLPADINQAARQHNIFASTCHISESPSSPPRIQLATKSRSDSSSQSFLIAIHSLENLSRLNPAQILSSYWPNAETFQNVFQEIVAEYKSYVTHRLQGRLVVPSDVQPNLYRLFAGVTAGVGAGPQS